MKRAFAFLLLCAAAVAQSPKTPVSARAASPEMRTSSVDALGAARIKADVRFLSHDLLEGRGTGQRGGDIAGQYIAAQFALMGLDRKSVV